MESKWDIGWGYHFHCTSLQFVFNPVYDPQMKKFLAQCFENLGKAKKLVRPF